MSIRTFNTVGRHRIHPIFTYRQQCRYRLRIPIISVRYRSGQRRGRDPSDVWQNFVEGAQNAYENVASSAAEFSQRHQLQEKTETFVRATSQRVKDTYEVLEDKVQKAASRADSRYNVTGRVQKATKEVQEKAQAFDSKYGVRRKLRNFGDDFQRNLPGWKKQWGQFSKTNAGKVVQVLAFFALIYSGIAARILDFFVFSLFWGPLILAPVFYLANRKALREQAEQRARAQQEAFRGFRGFWGPDVGGASRRGTASSARGGGYPPQRGPRRYSSDSGGPIIDAEWTDADAKK